MTNASSMPGAVKLDEWSLTLKYCYPTAKWVEDEKDILAWEALICRELGETTFDPDEVSLAIIWSKKAVTRDAGLGPPSAPEVADWVRQRRRHLKELEKRSVTEKRVDRIIEQLRAMDPNKRYEVICNLGEQMAAIVGPIAETLPGGLGGVPEEIARSLRRWIAKVGKGEEDVKTGRNYILLSFGEKLEKDDEYYDSDRTEWIPLGADAFDSDGKRRRYIGYKNSRIRRRVSDAGLVPAAESEPPDPPPGTLF